MRQSNWTPSIIPGVDDQNVYLVVADLGHLGQIWREAGVEMTDRRYASSPLTSLKAGAATLPRTAYELRRRCNLRLTKLPESLQDFVTRFEGAA